MAIPLLPMPAYNPGNSLLNFEPIQQALNQKIRKDQADFENQFRMDRAQKEDARYDEQSARLKAEAFGKKALAFSQLPDNQRDPAAWDRLLKEVPGDIPQQYRDPIKGPAMVAAEFGQFVQRDPLNDELKRLGIEAKREEIAASREARARDAEFFGGGSPAPSAGATMPPPTASASPQAAGAGRYAAPSIAQPQASVPGIVVQGGAPMAPPSQPQAAAAPQQPRTAQEIVASLPPELQAAGRMAVQQRDRKKLMELVAEAGKANMKPLTEVESKDTLLAKRMAEAEDTLGKVLRKDETGNLRYTDPETPDRGPTDPRNAFWPDGDTSLLFGGVTLPTGLANSQGWRQYSSAARNWIAAILRKDTGAAVTREEWDWYFPMYFPQPGDGPDVLAQKELARREVAQGLRQINSKSFDKKFPGFDQTLATRQTSAQPTTGGPIPSGNYDYDPETGTLRPAR